MVKCPVAKTEFAGANAAPFILPFLAGCIRLRACYIERIISIQLAMHQFKKKDNIIGRQTQQARDS